MNRSFLIIIGILIQLQAVAQASGTNCSEGDTQQQLKCVESKLSVAHEKMEDVYYTIMEGFYKKSEVNKDKEEVAASYKETKEDFMTAHANWREYKDSYCDTWMGIYSTGGLDHLAKTRCQLSLTLQRTTTLKSMQKEFLK